MNNLVIIGSGDTGREIIGLVDRINNKEKIWNIIGFVDDACQSEAIEGIPVLGSVSWLNKYNKDVYVVCAIGNGITKNKIITQITNEKIKFATLIDPTVQIHKGSRIEEGCIIYANVVLAINTVIGKHVYISFSSTIGHDTIIEDCSSIYPGCNLSGCVRVEENCVIGTGSKIIQGLQIGRNTVLGAGTVVINDVDSEVVAVGNPAKIIKKNG